MKNGGKREGAGRPPGSLNKVTTRVKANYIDFVNDNFDKVQKLFDKVAKENPARAIELYIKMSDYVIPKVAFRKEDQEPVKVLPPKVTFNIKKD